ncbi:MAG TPA: serine hydrolase, partial [Hyphomonadaceae bacterium]
GGGPDKGHEIWSGTKSFTGVMAAIAVRDGLLTLDEKVADTITEWTSDPVKSQVTVRQLLSLTSGIGNQGQPGGRAPGYRTAIATPFTAAPGEKFQYGPQSFQVFGELIQRKLKARGLDPDSRAFVKTRILDPIGMTWTDWRRTPEGDAIMAQGASFTAREWAKFGEFIRKGGIAPSGERLVDPSAFRELFIGSKANPAYGVSWWLPKATESPDVVTATIDLVRHSAELPPDMVIAGGAGNQRLYVIPSCRLTVVRQAIFNLQATLQERRNDTWSDFTFIRTVLDAYCN